MILTVLKGDAHFWGEDSSLLLTDQSRARSRADLETFSTTLFQISQAFRPASNTGFRLLYLHTNVE